MLQSGSERKEKEKKKDFMARAEEHYNYTWYIDYNHA
jgi:hypothetical protein